MRHIRPWTQFAFPTRRHFSQSFARQEIRDVTALPHRTQCLIRESDYHDLLALKWPRPLRNIFIARKDNDPIVQDAVLELAAHIQDSYPGVSLIFEPHVAPQIHDQLPQAIYTSTSPTPAQDFQRCLNDKVDLVTTLGGDGTILHATSFFAKTQCVPPVLSFSMGTLGFLGEWKFAEYKRAFRQVYMSGATPSHGSHLLASSELRSSAGPSPSEELPKTAEQASLAGWASVRGKSMGPSRGARVLVRNRLSIGIFDEAGNQVHSADSLPSGMISPYRTSREDLYAMNEVLLHRGAAPHLSVISIHVGGRFLTEAVADGMLVSTPTGSTAYSLSSGGSIVHPLVSSLLLTPICPRSLSFRPLVLPANTPITLRLSERNRSEQVDVSIDGVRQREGLRRGMEVRVVGEETRTENGNWVGGMPSVVRAGGQDAGDSQDHWVGGLNALLKFNYPFGEDG